MMGSGAQGCPASAGGTAAGRGGVGLETTRSIPSTNSGTVANVRCAACIALSSSSVSVSPPPFTSRAVSAALLSFTLELNKRQSSEARKSKRPSRSASVTAATGAVTEGAGTEGAVVAEAAAMGAGGGVSLGLALNGGDKAGDGVYLRALGVEASTEGDGVRHGAARLQQPIECSVVELHIAAEDIRLLCQILEQPIPVLRCHPLPNRDHSHRLRRLIWRRPRGRPLLPRLPR